MIFLARDPRDVAVSQYFQWKYRMKPNKKDINAYPTADLEPFEFVMSEAGLPKVIEFMNLWAKEAPRIREFMIVRYEDLRAAPGGDLGPGCSSSSARRRPRRRSPMRSGSRPTTT